MISRIYDEHQVQHIFILSNILIEAANSKLKITATDLDLIFVNEISNIKIFDEGKTTTSSSIMFDIVRKIPSGSQINFENTGESKLQLESNKSLFNLNSINAYLNLPQIFNKSR